MYIYTYIQTYMWFPFLQIDRLRNIDKQIYVLYIILHKHNYIHMLVCIILYVYIIYKFHLYGHHKHQSLNHAQLFVIPWTIAHETPLSMKFSRQEYWSGFPFLSPGDLPNPGIKPRSSALQADSLLAEPHGHHNVILSATGENSKD